MRGAESLRRGEWPGTAAVDRGRLLWRVADLLERDKEIVARAESLDTGKRFVESGFDVERCGQLRTGQSLRFTTRRSGQ